MSGFSKHGLIAGYQLYFPLLSSSISHFTDPYQKHHTRFHSHVFAQVILPSWKGKYLREMWQLGVNTYTLADYGEFLDVNPYNELYILQSAT